MAILGLQPVQGRDAAGIRHFSLCISHFAFGTGAVYAKCKVKNAKGKMQNERYGQDAPKDIGSMPHSWGIRRLGESFFPNAYPA
jgi:hypothetical protein